MSNETAIPKAVSALLDAAPGARVILFGSYARGDAKRDSDLDFLVVEPCVASQRAEMVRLSEVLRHLGIYADVLVVSEEAFREWRDAPGTVIFNAVREGREFRASA